MRWWNLWHLNVYNKKMYDKTGVYHCEVIRPPFLLDEMEGKLDGNIRDFAIASYELPFPLTGKTWEVIEKMTNQFSIMVVLEEIECTVLGQKFDLLKNHFFEGNIMSYLKGLECIKLLPVNNYAGAVCTLISSGYLAKEFLLNYFDFEAFLSDKESQMNIDELKTLGLDYLDIIAQKVHTGDYLKYLKLEEIKSYLKSQFRVLETEVGFFVDDRKMDAYWYDQFGRGEEFKLRFEKLIDGIETRIVDNKQVS